MVTQERLEQPPTRPVGRVRHPALVALLVLVTFGVYGWFWLYRVFKEVDDHSGQEHGWELFIVGLLLLFVALTGAVVLMVYGGQEMEKLRHAKLARGLPAGMTQGGYYGLVIGTAVVAMLIFVTFFPAAMVGLVVSLLVGEPIGLFLAGLVIGFLAMNAVTLAPYVVLQTQVNKYWQGLGTGGAARVP